MKQAPSRYDEKLIRIRAGNYQKGDFIIADAKDADLAGGILTTGNRRDAQGKPAGKRSRQEFLLEIETLISDDTIDILLGSSRTIEALMQRGCFEHSSVKPAFRANDTTDVWGNIRGGRYQESASMPYSSTMLDHAQAQLCLYSVTFNNDAVLDKTTLEAYRDFRRNAAAANKLHFLEVFNPNISSGLGDEEVGFYVNDCICRCLAGLTQAEKPEFLKVVYNGAHALSELVEHDSETIVGVLGGGMGTHRDTFELIAQAERFGARVALFGRKINAAEHQSTFVRWMRRVADGDTTPKDAVAGYHDALLKLGFCADRTLDADQMITEKVLMPEAL